MSHGYASLIYTSPPAENIKAVHLKKDSEANLIEWNIIHNNKDKSYLQAFLHYPLFSNPKKKKKKRDLVGQT